MIEVISGLEAELFACRVHNDGTIKKESLLFVDNFSSEINEETLFKKAINTNTYVAVFKGSRSVRGSFTVKSLLDAAKFLNVLGVNYVDNGAASKKIGTAAASWYQGINCTVVSNYSYDPTTQLFGTVPKSHSWHINGTNDNATLRQVLNIPYFKRTLLTDYADLFKLDDVFHSLFVSFASQLVSGCVTVRIYGKEQSGAERNVLLVPLVVAGSELITIPLTNTALRLYDLDSLYFEVSTKYHPSSTTEVPISNPANTGEAYITDMSISEGATGQFTDRSKKNKIENTLFLEYAVTRNTGDLASLVFTDVVVPTFSLSDTNDINMESLSFIASDVYLLDGNVKAENENWGNWHGITWLGEV